MALTVSGQSACTRCQQPSVSILAARRVSLLPARCSRFFRTSDGARPRAARYPVEDSGHADHTSALIDAAKRDVSDEGSNVLHETELSAAAENAILGEGDRDLREALIIASVDELKELAAVLFGASLLSPLGKSVFTAASNRPIGVQSATAELEDILSALEVGSARIDVVRRLEARFLFLAADCVATLRGERPTYRATLLRVRERLGVACRRDLAAVDLENEIFLHLMLEATTATESTPGAVATPTPAGNGRDSGAAVSPRGRSLTRAATMGGVAGRAMHRLVGGTLRRATAAVRSTLQPLRLGGQELLPLLAQGATAVGFTVAKRALLKRAAAEALWLRARSALASSAAPAAAAAAARYGLLRGGAALLGPMLWGATLAELTASALGTDYGRIVRAIFALAQIRLTRSYGFTRGGGATGAA